MLTDANVEPLYASACVESLRFSNFLPVVWTIAPGESSKTVRTVEAAYAFLTGRRFPRDGLILALGGGVVSDLAGFVAATWMRGVRWAVCPTTLEAAIDASIGGKTGINVAGGKNLVGAFHAPCCVVVDPLCLRTLPRREFVAGLAESIKQALVASPELFSWHERETRAILDLDGSVLTRLIRENIRIKSEIVAQDPLEQSGARLVLNFGHTIGHAIEECSAFSLRHGECVSLGMVAACRLSQRMGLLGSDEVERVVRVLNGVGLPTRLDHPLSPEALMDVMGLDKKRKAGLTRFVLLQGLGRPVVRTDVGHEVLRDVCVSLTV